MSAFTTRWRLRRGPQPAREPLLTLVRTVTAFAQDSKGGTAGEPAPDAKRSGVVNEESGERPRDQMNPHKNYSNTEKNVDNAPVYAPGTDTAPRDNAAGQQKSGETATTPKPPDQR
jgi:hypothetical protein